MTIDLHGIAAADARECALDASWREARAAIAAFHDGAGDRRAAAHALESYFRFAFFMGGTRSAARGLMRRMAGEFHRAVEDRLAAPLAAARGPR